MLPSKEELDALDEKTLALLVAVSELSGKSHSPDEVVKVYLRALENTKQYRTGEEKLHEYTGL